VRSVESRTDTLETQVLAMPERALQEGWCEVADHLLRALETSAGSADGSDSTGSVALAYERLARSGEAI
jgi:hypothetical protein